MKKQQANTVTLPMISETLSAVLAVRYTKDANFRAEFDKDPKAALAKLDDWEVSSDVKIVVHRNDDKCWHITLPSEEAMAAMKDGDIEKMAGGFAPWDDLREQYPERVYRPGPRFRFPP